MQDDIVLLARDATTLQKHLNTLANFCTENEMEVNLEKSKIIIVGTRSDFSFCYKELELEQVKVYKYLGIDFSHDYSWSHCVQKRVEASYKALYSFLNKCRRAHLVSWELWKFLFKTLVLSVILYGIQVWGPGCKKTSWKCLERIQKMFLQEKLGVKNQTPYAILMAETGFLPVEVEALYLTINYVARLRSFSTSRLPCQALQDTRLEGWLSDVGAWSSRWNVEERHWDMQPLALRQYLQESFLNILWSRSGTKMEFYRNHVNPMLIYCQQGYLSASISTFLRHIIARNRKGSHGLHIEEGRWHNVERSERFCTVCESRDIEDEEHVFIICSRYSEIRTAHKIVVTSFYSLLQLEPYALGCYFTDALCCRSIALSAFEGDTPLV